MIKGRIIFCAGGTGGHIFPAVAVIQKLIAAKHEVELYGDPRATVFLEKSGLKIPYRELQISRPAAGLLGKLKALFEMMPVVYQCILDFIKDRPKVVVGFGGYPSLPPLVAAIVLFIPVVIHQQDAVMGRSNRILSFFASKIGLSFPEVVGMNRLNAGKAFVTGPIVRNEFQPSSRNSKKSKKFKILVTGGSQGAAALSTAIPKALQIIEPGVQKHIEVLQQVRPEHHQATLEAYSQTTVKYKVVDFIPNMGEAMMGSDLIIARAGIGTISEIVACARGAVLIPYPNAKDNHQYHNAKILEERGAAIVIEESGFNLISFSRLLTRFCQERENLDLMALRAGKLYKKDAVETLVKAVLQLVKR